MLLFKIENSGYIRDFKGMKETFLFR